ncbi:hypothetical protein HZR00_00850 [Elizabethkingia anophelis]|nr:hypothetical protein [Elizabethkingia anophelis]
MKKILFFLLLSIFAFGQNVELLKKANKCDLDFARSFSNSILADYKLVKEGKSTSNNFIYEFTYLPPDATKEDIENFEKQTQCKKCVWISFNIFTEGANKDLEIKGTTFYSFNEANGSFKSLFPFWQKNIEPTATTDKTYESNPVYSVRKDNLGIWYNFFKINTGSWFLRNMTDRINEFK